MRCYVVFFDTRDAEEFNKRAEMLEKTAGLTVHYMRNDPYGQLFGIYITEQTATRFPQFLTEFNGGKWLDHEPV
ncbi:MAG TPA: hypothetical protein VN956_04375 [Pyrinomonadaceae bacterium]|nr:hypothetical protein [Pyrinomonadaceae bacterium]